MPDDRDIEFGIVRLLAARAPGASVCPSEVARALFAPEWREAMPRVRAVARALARQSVIRATQGDETLEPDAIPAARGPIRLRRGVAYPVTGADASEPSTTTGSKPP